MKLEQIAQLFFRAATIPSNSAEVGRLCGELEDLGLLSGEALTDRGRAFVDHVCALPLPEQVTIWRIAAANYEWAQANPLVRASGRVGDIVRFMPGEPEGQPPPPAPPAKRINGVAVPEDPEEKRRLGLQMMSNGAGVGEVAELLGVSFAEADGWFLGK